MRRYFFIFYVILAVILLSGAKVAEKGKWREDPLSRQSSQPFLGFCALCIILIHIAQAISAVKKETGVLKFMEDLAANFVGFFFFFSGYGLYRSLQVKQEYMKHFLKNRLPEILIPFYVCNFTFISGSCIGGYQFEKGELLPYITGWILMNNQMWYIVEIFILYLIFYLIFNRVKNMTAAFALFLAATIGITFLGLLSGHDILTRSLGLWFHGEWWYNSTFLIFIGMLLARWREPLYAFARKYYIPLLVLGILATVMLYHMTCYMLHNIGYWCEWDGYRGYREKLMTLGIQLPFVIITVVTVALIFLKVEFGNKVLNFFGEIKLELYLIHNLFILYLPIRTRFYLIIGVYVAAILLATILHALDRKLIGIVKKRLPDF